jgi:hypothetical protein
MRDIDLQAGAGGAGRGGTRGPRLALLAGAAVLVTAAAGLGAVAMASSGGDGATTRTHAFALPAEGEKDPVHARVTMTIGKPAKHRECGRLGAATVYPITLTVRNDDPTGWQYGSDRRTTPDLALGLGRADGTQDPSAPPTDPFIVTDANCRPFEDVADKVMEIPAHREATVHLELQASAAPAHEQVVMAVMSADDTTGGLAETTASWAVRLDGAEFPLPARP